MGKFKTWTIEEKVYLQDHWGSKSAVLIARKLDRSYGSVIRKASKIGLSSPTLHYDGITTKELARVLGISFDTIKKWRKQYSFPSKQKVFSKKQRINVVSYQDFWNWAEKHQDFINFANLEPLILGKEPDWVHDKRKVDRYKIKNQRLWTNEEINRLENLVNSFQYTYPEVASLLKRSEASIKTKLIQLDIKARPLSLDRCIKYTDEEIDFILRMLSHRYSFNAIADFLNNGISKNAPKSANAIHGKLERMGFSFYGDIPIAVPLSFKSYVIVNEEARE